MSRRKKDENLNWVRFKMPSIFQFMTYSGIVAFFVFSLEGAEISLIDLVDTIGFCGRFFAEAMAEVDQGPEEALKSIGANRFDIIISAVLLAAMPSFVNSALFALEKAVRSSVVLGLVGAGGIGIEPKVAMDMFQSAL
jgi:ABC-type phosphate/phosphonate transport system permease subunit